MKEVRKGGLEEGRLELYTEGCEVDGWEGGTKADSRDHAATSTPGVCLLADHSATSYQDTERREGWWRKERKMRKERGREKRV